MKRYFEVFLKGHDEAFQKSFHDDSMEVLNRIAQSIINAFKAGRKVILCGNGGSGTDALHVAAEFVGRFEMERMSLPAIAPSADTASITAIGNDYGYDRVFERQLESLGHKGDVLIALSTSGRSPNILKAVEKAKQKGLLTIGFTGREGGSMKGMVDHCFCVHSQRTAHIQEIHMIALHAICGVVEQVLFG